MESKEETLKIQNLIIYYFLCAFIGWILEMIYGYMVFGKFVDRGFLYGPICPIYGYGAVMMVLITEKVRKKNINLIGTFFIITIIFTLLEYLASLGLELIFHLRWWDYTNEFLNLNGRVCLAFSVLFGIMGIMFIKWVYDPSKKIIEKVRSKLSTKVVWILLIVFAIASNVDTVFSIIKYIKI